MNNVPRDIRCQVGYSLIEVMVSVFVMALGILGMTGLQTASLKHSTHSMQRTKAAYLSYEILDRMRANTESTYAVELDAEPIEQECFSASCTPDELMAFDIAEWKCALGKHGTSPACVALAENQNVLLLTVEALPGGDGSVSCTLDTGTKICTVTVQWYEQNGGSGGRPVETRSFEVTSNI